MLVASMMHTCSAQQSELDEKSSVILIFVSDDNELKRAGRAILFGHLQSTIFKKPQWPSTMILPYCT